MSDEWIPPLYRHLLIEYSLRPWGKMVPRSSGGTGMIAGEADRVGGSLREGTTGVKG